MMEALALVGVCLVMLVGSLLVKFASLCFYVIPRGYEAVNPKDGSMHKYIPLPFGRAILLCWPPISGVLCVYEDEEISVVRDGVPVKIRFNYPGENDGIRTVMQSMMEGDTFSVRTKEQFRIFMEKVALQEQLPDFVEFVQ